MKQIELGTKIWVKFCMNYPDIREVIKWICEKTNNKYLYDHLYQKFCFWYDKSTSDGAMTRFYCELDSSMQNALAEYAFTVWAPHGMSSTFPEFSQLAEIPCDKEGKPIRKGDIVWWIDPETKAMAKYEVYKEPTMEMVKLWSESGECEALPTECIIA